MKITTKDYSSKPVSDLTFTVGFNSLTTFKGFYKRVPAGKFDKGLLSDPFFSQSSYVGALDASNDWTTGWAAWGK